jgi:glycosyltransferase involved in cell wall biosynthesis
MSTSWPADVVQVAAEDRTGRMAAGRLQFLSVREGVDRLAAQSPGHRRVVVVMPAYNAARTLAATWQAIPSDVVDEVLLVDDRSADETLAIATRLPIRSVALPHNVGYGGNQKMCYLEALRLGADVVVMLHPDGQYDPAVLPDLVAPILAGEADLVLGSRMLIPGAARRGRMPWYRYFSNKALTRIENRVLGTAFSELHTGYRAYSRQFLETVPFLRNSNDFVFDTQVIAQAVAFGQRIAEIPIETNYHPDASSTSMRANVRYGVGTLVTIARFRLDRMGVVRHRLFRT